MEIAASSFKPVRLLFLFAAAFALSKSAYCQAPVPPEIENEQVLGINKQPWHATLVPYGDLPQAIAAVRANSSFAQSLNGTWKFHYVPRPEQRPLDFYKPKYDVSHWDSISVPSCWQLKGYGTPYYRNSGYTFKDDWPHVMDEPPKNWTAYTERNPVGSYRRDFAVPAAWTGREVFLKFDGVDSAFFIWINGQKVGYSTNSRNAAEFNVTSFLKASGPNTLAVEVYRYCSGSYMEDQDMWRLSGIFRNVTLWSAPLVHVRDFTVTTDLDSAYNDATLKVSGIVHNYTSGTVMPRSFAIQLFDKSGKAVGKASSSVNVPALQAGQEAEVNVAVPVSNPLKWTAETPNLYTVVLSLRNGAQTTELLSHQVGFRKIEIKGRLFEVNGVPIKLKGANRHENWPDTGHYVTEARMIQDIKLLKQANCNHVRTSHYSDDPRWYELCDQYGIWVLAEANVECNGLEHTLDHEPRFEKMIVDRNVANVENLKNNPSIIIWSMGNESGGGSNLRVAEGVVRGLDPTRPTHYERFGVGAGNPAAIDDRMYDHLDELENFAHSTTLTKPFYVSEYAHSMFNSMGGLDEYSEMFDKYPALLGGAIWEWSDQGIVNNRDPKRQFIAYGGGFGEVPNDGYFIHKGVVFSDRSPKPAYAEVKRAYQWIGFAADDLKTGRIKIKNKYAFLNLSGFTGHWIISEDGAEIQSGALPKLNLAPSQEAVVQAAFKPFTPKPGAKYYLRIGMSLSQDASWAKEGYEVAAAQFELPLAKAALQPNLAGLAPITLSESGSRVTVTGRGFRVGFDKTTGLLSEISRGGINVLLPGGGPKLHLWRAEHRNDDGYAASGWKDAGLDSLEAHVINFQSEQLSPQVARITATIEYTGKNHFSVTHTTSTTVYGDGTIAVDNAVVPHGPSLILARIGVRLLLDKRLGSVDYLARGPMENYSDRKQGSDIGHYTSTVAQQMTPYAKPMECGNHEDASWVGLKGTGMPAFLAQADGAAMQFSTLPYTDEQMEPVQYLVDMPTSTATVLCLSVKTLGVGSSSCGPIPWPQYILNSAPTSFSYVLRLLPSSSDLAATARMRPDSHRPKPALALRDATGAITLDANGN